MNYTFTGTFQNATLDWIPIIYDKIPNRWAEWNTGSLSCFDLIESFSNISYTSGRNEGILIGLSLAIIGYFSYKFVLQKSSEVKDEE